MSWAITGTGMITGVGSNVRECFNSFVSGTSGIHPLQGFDRSRFRGQSAYEITDRTSEGHDRPFRATSWLLKAIEQAVAEAGLAGDRRGIAVLVGTGLRELRSVELWWSQQAAMNASDLHFAGAIDRALGLGHTVTFSNACSASLFALGIGSDLLDLGEADVVVAAGVDSVTESMYGLLDRMNLEAPTAVRPFDQDRMGVLLGDGAAAVVLERTDDVVRRGGTPRAVLRGVGLNCDAHHLTAPAASGIAAAMRDAHRRAEVTPGQVELMMAHGTGTALNDEAEATALHEVFGSAGHLLVTGLKSMSGHTSGASGLVGLVTAVESMRNGVVPPTLGLIKPIPEVENFDLVTTVARRRQIQLAQVNAFGFGGVNAVAIVERTTP